MESAFDRTSLLVCSCFAACLLLARREGLPAPDTVEPVTLRGAGHLLNRAAHGPTRGELARVQEAGIAAWIEEQLRPETLDDTVVEERVTPLFEDRDGTRRIRGIDELKAFAHVHSIYSRRQLQSVLAEFWENHFVTDFDKVASWLDELRNSDASEAFSTEAARKEAAQLEYEEFRYFREHALGSFGDLLRYSARSPTMLVYLDNVINVLGNANENYAREILELHTFGVDNGYTQADIEQVARCFTGWGVAKVARENAGNPHAPTGMRVEDRVLVAPGVATEASGAAWRYFKGTQEPPADWTAPEFEDSGWLEGAGGIGYGDGDDATVLADMQNRYTTVYMRKRFVLKDPSALREHLILSVLVDDGFVAYLNGVEVARLGITGAAGDRVPHTATAASHEAGRTPILYNARDHKDKLREGTNVLAIQVVNRAPESSDLTMVPQLIDRKVLEGSIENGDPRGVFDFHFFADMHNARDPKTIFSKTPHQSDIPPRSGPQGLQAAEEVIERILDHPSTAEFVCVKLIQKFVGDEIDHRKPEDGPYASLLARCIETWNSTTPKGTIRDVVRVILTSDEFWSDRAYRSKVKDPFETIASSARALGAESSGLRLADPIRGMGMHIFTRDDPDGWPEVGSELIDTGTFQKRIAFFLQLSAAASPRKSDLYWDPAALLGDEHSASPEAVVSFFDDLFFQGTLSPEDREIVREYLGTDSEYKPVSLNRERDDFSRRVRQAVGLMLSLPDWQLQ